MGVHLDTPNYARSYQDPLKTTKRKNWTYISIKHLDLTLDNIDCVGLAWR